MVHDTHKRSISKAITWRIAATVTTFTLVFIFTRDLSIALTVGIIEAVAKMIIYYLHERVWDLTDWGIE